MTFYLEFIKENVPFSFDAEKNNNIEHYFVFLSLDRELCCSRRLATKKHSNLIQFYNVIWPEHCRYASNELYLMKDQLQIIDASKEDSAEIITTQQLFLEPNSVSLLSEKTLEEKKTKKEKLYQMALERLKKQTEMSSSSSTSTTTIDKSIVLPDLSDVCYSEQTDKILGAAFASALGKQRFTAAPQIFITFF